MSTSLIIVITIGIIATISTILANLYIENSKFVYYQSEYFYKYVVSIFLVPYIFLHELSHLLSSLFLGLKYNYINLSMDEGNYMYSDYTNQKRVYKGIEVYALIIMLFSGYLFPNVFYPSLILLLLSGHSWFVFYIALFLVTYVIVIRFYHEKFSKIKHLVKYRIIGAVIFLATLSHNRYLVILEFLERYYIIPILLSILLLSVIIKKYDFFIYLVTLLSVFYVSLLMGVDKVYYLYFAFISWNLSMWLMLGHLVNLHYNDKNNINDETDSEIIGSILNRRPLLIGILLVSIGFLLSELGLLIIYIIYINGGMN